MREESRFSARTRIKVCGITDIEDAADAVAAGVDALGFIFVGKSPRNIDPEKVREIIRILPPFVDAVGVFVDEDDVVVNELVQYCGLTVVQLHGKESPHYCKKISCRVVKSFGVRSETELSDFEPYFDAVDGFLLDTFHEEIAGGTGNTFDWSVMEKIPLPKPVILAGGLTPENIGEAIDRVRPFAVDVNSGVEKEPGKKDIVKIKRLFQAVMEADDRLGKA